MSVQLKRIATSVPDCCPGRLIHFLARVDLRLTKLGGASPNTLGPETRPEEKAAPKFQAKACHYRRKRENHRSNSQCLEIRFD